MNPRLPGWRERWGLVRHTEVHQSADEPVQATTHHPELKCPDAASPSIKLSILRSGTRSRFRLSAAFTNSALVVALREDGTAQGFELVRRSSYWESIEEIPLPHRFRVALFLGHDGHTHSYRTRFVEFPSPVVRELESPRRLKESSVANWLSHPIIAAVSHDRSIRSPHGP